MWTILLNFILIAASITDVKGIGVDVKDQKESRAAYKEWLKMFDNTLNGLKSGGRERYKIFQKNFDFISKETANGNVGYEMKLNQFATLSDIELDAYTGINVTDLNKLETIPKRQSSLKNSPIPLSINYWRTLGLSLPVEIPQFCRVKPTQSWAYAAAAALEGQYKILTDELVLLSEWQLLECSYPTHRFCNNGWMDAAFKYVDQRKTLPHRSLYSGYDCLGIRSQNALSRAEIKEYNFVPAGDDNLRRAVSEIGPIAAGMYAKKNLFFYEHGIYGRAGECPAHKDADIAVTVVGYRPDKWIIKNFWGTNWGNVGYLYLGRDIENMCKISSYAISVEMATVPGADDVCAHVPALHRQPCWHHSRYILNENTCEGRGCCWDSSTKECFVKAKITLYTERYFRGISMTFYGTVDNLEPYYMVVFSLKVHYGKFIVYNSPNFGEKGSSWEDVSLGILSPGDYDNLDDYSFAHIMYSLRALPTSPDVISLFGHTYGRGEMLTYYRSYPWLGRAKNDKVSSSYTTGNWKVCDDAYSYDCKAAPGYQRNLGDMGLNDKVSGVRYNN